jgi:hypothetical protein
LNPSPDDIRVLSLINPSSILLALFYNIVEIKVTPKQQNKNNAEKIINSNQKRFGINKASNWLGYLRRTRRPFFPWSFCADASLEGPPHIYP